MSDHAITRLTRRLRLEPIGPDAEDDLFRLHQDAGIAAWYGGPWTREQVKEAAAAMGRGWYVEGVHKWIAYDRESNVLIGRGGLSYAYVEGERRLEIGWALRQRFWGMGYASEIGGASLNFAFSALRADEVVSFTETYNRRSRAVMERLGFSYAREILHRGKPFALYVLSQP